MITIHLRSGQARNLMEALIRTAEHPRQVMSAAAVAGRAFLQDHFAELNKKPNKLGGRKTGFWQDVLRSTQLGEITDSTADIEIGDSRFAQRLHGGEIKAKRPWKGSGMLLLTIPVHPAAHGRRVSVTERELGLRLTFVGSAKGGVIGHFAEHAANDEIYYVCVPSVIQEPDPDALPDRQKLEDAAATAAQDELTLQAQEAQAQSQGAT